MATTDEQEGLDTEDGVDSEELTILAAAESEDVDSAVPDTGAGASDDSDAPDVVASMPRRFGSEDADFDATRLYLNEIGASKLLTAEEEVYYARLAQKGDNAARKRMIVSNLRLVVKIARRYLNRGLPLLDLIEEGNVGLIKAANHFRPEEGWRFPFLGFTSQPFHPATVSSIQPVGEMFCIRW